jgi:polyhydroxyalkanoate synthesis regulator phasin
MHYQRMRRGMGRGSMTNEELKELVDEIIKRTRNQDTVAYEDVDKLIIYIDMLEYALSRLKKLIE